MVLKVEFDFWDIIIYVIGKYCIGFCYLYVK